MNKVVMFTLGAAVGSLVTWKLVEAKYKKIADEEIEEIRQYYKNKIKTDSLNIIEPYTETYEKQIDDLGYAVSEDEEKPYEIFVEPGVDRIEPFVISPNEYGEIEDFDTKCWTYYADLVLVDEEGEVVSDPESIIGDALSHFGDYEDDSVHVRNENIGIECDYEIIKHKKTFSEIYGSED